MRVIICNLFWQLNEESFSKSCNISLCRENFWMGKGIQMWNKILFKNYFNEKLALTMFNSLKCLGKINFSNFRFQCNYQITTIFFNWRKLLRIEINSCSLIILDSSDSYKQSQFRGKKSCLSFNTQFFFPLI